MIKHLLVAITLLSGCAGYHWFYNCDDPNRPADDTYCTTDDNGDDPCAGEGDKTYYVWLVDEGSCGEVGPLSFCAPDDATAQTIVNSTYFDSMHGAASTDPHATEPTKITMCGSNPSTIDPNDPNPADCVLGSADESIGTTFWYFTDDQIAYCEMGLDPGCTQWVMADGITNTCPGQM